MSFETLVGVVISPYANSIEIAVAADAIGWTRKNGRRSIVAFNSNADETLGLIKVQMPSEKICQGPFLVHTRRLKHAGAEE